MSKQLFMGRTAQSLLDECKNQPGDLKIEDKTLLTMTELAEVRQALEENHKTIMPCYNRDFDPFGWAVDVVKSSDYIDY